MEVPRWAVEEYEGAAKDFSDWLYNVLYESMVKEAPEDKQVAYRLMAQVKARSLERTDSLEGLMARSRAWQMWKAQQEGWYHFLPGEYDTLKEFMQSIADDNTPESTKSDLLFMANTLLPALENMGIPASSVIDLPANFTKARTAVPYLRDALDNQTGDQLTETIHEILKDIGDDSITTREYRDKLGARTRKVQTIWGDVYVLPGYDLIVVRSTDPSFQKYLERRTKGVIEFRGPKDPIELLKEITDQLTGEEDDDN